MKCKVGVDWAPARTSKTFRFPFKFIYIDEETSILCRHDSRSFFLKLKGVQVLYDEWWLPGWYSSLGIFLRIASSGLGEIRLIEDSFESAEGL